MNSIKFKSTFLFMTFLSIFSHFSDINAASVVGDSINVSRITTAPVIDGNANDLCWDSAVWNPMPYVWIVYGQKIDSSDFYGRFKAVWSEMEQLMYFVFEITDDKFVNGYEYSSTNGNYYLFDVVEIFIDENRSGGVHETNNNAFAYHITGGNSTSDYDAVDMWSTSRVNYKDHFPEFKRVQNGTVHTWEFSMRVLKDTFTPTSSPENFKATLTAGKSLGFSAAYCDNDNSAINPKRDHFIASKYLTQANSNESYKNANHFGFMKLVNEPPGNPLSSESLSITESIKLNVHPNPVVDFAELSFKNNYSGTIKISVYNATGKVISTAETIKTNSSFNHRVSFNNFGSGLYFIKVSAEKEHSIIKIIK